MTAVFDTYCTSERSEFSVFGDFVGKKDELDSVLNFSLIKSHSIELYEVTKEKKVRFITSSRLLLTPVACTTLMGLNGMPDYIVLLFANWEIMLYRYSSEYTELELVTKDQIEIGDLLRGSSLRLSQQNIVMDDNIKMEQIQLGTKPNGDDLVLMITSPKFLLFITYKMKSNRNDFTQELSLGTCWGILVETDIYMDTIVDSCQILDENSNLCLQPKIAILTRIGPISTGSIQSHSNCVSLIYLSINMELTEFTVLDKLELLPMDSYKLIPFDTSGNINMCLSGGLIVLSTNSIILHGGLNRPFTLITTNDSYNNVPEKKLEVDLCAQKVHGFKPKTFGFETGTVILDGNHASTTSNDNSELLNTINLENLDSNLDLRTLLSNLQPILINQPELSIEFQVSNSVPFLITNEYYGILLFNKIQPYLIGLMIHLSPDQPNGIKGFNWFKVNEYWDWNRSYLPRDHTILSLETVTLSKKLGSETTLDEHYLITSTPIFRVQNVHFIQQKNASSISNSSNDAYISPSLLLIGDIDSNSGLSILDFTFNETFLIPYAKNQNITQDPQLSYNAIVNLIRSKEEIHSSMKDEKNKKIKKTQIDSGINLVQPYSDSCLEFSSIEDLERFYIYSDIPKKEDGKSEQNLGILKNIKIRDYLDLGPNSLRDFCIIPSFNSCNEEFESEEYHKKCPIDERHSILSTNGTYPIGQLSLYEKSVSKSVITKFFLDDILFHWALNDPITNKTKYLVFTSDPLKSIGKTHFFSLDTCINNSQEMVIIGDVNQLDPSDGEFDYEVDSNTVGAGMIKMGNSYDDIFVIQVLPSTINVLDFGISTRLVELDLISNLFFDNPDAPMAIKSFIMGNFILILFEDSTIKVLKIFKPNEDLKKGTEHIDSSNSLKMIAEFSRYQIIVESMDNLFEELDNLCEINQLVVKQRIMEGEISQLFEDEPFETSKKQINTKETWKNQFWIRHISPVITNSDRNLKDPEDFLVVLVIYSKLWLNGSIAIYNLVKKRLVFFSPFISAVPCLMGNVLSQTGSKEEIIYRFLENEFDLGRPITSICTPIIEPKYYIAKEGGISISPTFSLNPGELDTTNQSCDSNFTQNSSSFLISCELIKMEEEDSKEGNSEMIMVASVSQKPMLIYRLDLRSNNSSSNLRSEDYIFSRKWKLEIQTNFNNVQMDISKFFAQFPVTLTSSNIEETFSNESPLSIYNCGHGISFNSKISSNVDTWIIQAPSPLNIEVRQELMSDETKLSKIGCFSSSSLVIMTDKGRFSVVNLDETGMSNCIAKIDSPWSPLHILLKTSIKNEINFEFLNLADSSSNSKLCNSLSTLPFPGNDNWFLRRAFLPEVVIQRVAFCKEYNLIAIIVGIPDNAKHHLNGYHIRQMAFYRYLRCLEAGGKEAQTILLNQDLIRNPDKCFEKSLASIPDLGIPPASFETETYFDTLPPGIEIGESLPKIFYQSNIINEKARKSDNCNQSSTCNNLGKENVAPNLACKDFEREQFGILKDLNIMRNELLLYSFEDLFPHSKLSNPVLGRDFESFPKPKGRYAFGAWEVGLSMKFGQDSKGQQVLIIGTGTNPTHYYEAEGRLLMFKVKQLVSLDEEDGNVVVKTGNGAETETTEATGTGVRANNAKWTNMLKYWPSKFSKQLYHDNVQELEICFQSMYRGPVTSVDLINLPATTAQVAPAIPALAAYPIIQNNPIVRAPNSNVTYIAHTFGYRLYIHELRENESSFIKGTFIDTPLGISSVSNYKALFFLGDIRRGVHFGMLRTDASRGSQTMVKFARSHPLWKFTCTSAQAIVQEKDLAILVSDNNNNLFTFEPNFGATQIIDKETLKPTSHTNLCTSIVHMRTVESENYRYVIASGRNGSFFSIKLTNKLQHEHLLRVEKLLCCNIPSFLGISPNTSLHTNKSLNNIPDFIQNLYPTDKIIFLKHLNYLKYLSNPILQSIFKNTNTSLSHILQFIV
ncbi:uncharacterized protein cubi_03702 [Cryptosporidium ubiquitum]|uniref:RSE1/DDB1/CPSF1 C-terminal domain-containing protein n=1 Tax=Cryptosporidium ubiquitum TaxID=857276 RepID=A0A1J4MF26_9CRYT|nr:uncharacterized protein cubi_03702 [Cryptosporidium ubiquitum]OII72832.1 hypothetical protein cubi_03702 [Cryptosporidium ubiquitum]